MATSPSILNGPPQTCLKYGEASGGEISFSPGWPTIPQIRFHHITAPLFIQFYFKESLEFPSKAQATGGSPSLSKLRKGPYFFILPLDRNLCSSYNNNRTRFLYRPGNGRQGGFSYDRLDALPHHRWRGLSHRAALPPYRPDRTAFPSLRTVPEGFARSLEPSGPDRSVPPFW